MPQIDRVWVPIVSLLSLVLACSSSSSSASGASAMTYGCTDAEQDNGCFCEIGAAGSAYTETTCDKPAGGVCCADSAWPSTDGSCECFFAPPACEIYDTGFCTCSRFPTAGKKQIATCYANGKGTAPVAGEALGTCCKTAGSCDCIDLECQGTIVDKCTPEDAADCPTGAKKNEVSTCTPGSSSGGSSGSSGDTDSGTTDSCPDKSDRGVCGPTASRCTCGLSCLTLGVGSYKCKWPCTSDSDCAGKSDPYSGTPQQRCQAGTNGYDGFCYDTP